MLIQRTDAQGNLFPFSSFSSLLALLLNFFNAGMKCRKTHG
jgi:hypothetical protein